MQVHPGEEFVTLLASHVSMLVARALNIGKIAEGGMPPTYETMH
jgi:hypothetical protein